MFDYRGWFVSPNISARAQSFIDSLTLYAYDATDVLDDDKYATVLESFGIISSLQVIQSINKKESRLDNLVLDKKDK